MSRSLSVTEELKCSNCNKWYSVTYHVRHSMYMCPSCGCNVAADVRPDTTGVRPLGAPESSNPPLNSGVVTHSLHSHAAWLATVDRITRQWLHDVSAVYDGMESRALAKAALSGFAMVPDTTAARVTLFADVNAERAELGLSPLTDKDI